MNFTKQYDVFSKELKTFIGLSCWDKAYIKYEIYYKMISVERCFIFDENENWFGNDIPDEIWNNTSRAIYYIRDTVLKNTENRIWGLLFTLYPDGRFEVEYDYNKPEGYEETDELITGDEINQSLGGLS